MMFGVSIEGLATKPTSTGYTDYNDGTIQLTAMQNVKSGCVIEATYELDGTVYTVVEIGDSEGGGLSAVAFKSCTTLTINANAKIYDNAFANWSALTTVTIGVDVPMKIGADVFPESVEKIVVPAGKAKVFAEAAGWSAYAGVIEDVNGQKATALEDVEMGEKVVIAGRVIKLAEEGHIVVTELTGRSIDCGVRSSYVIEGSGLYIVTVKIGDEMITKRVLVR